MIKKTLIAVICLVGLSSIAFAGDICDDYSKLAGKIMEHRQAGEPMSETMDTASAGGKVAQDLVEAAYGVPRYNTEERQERAIKVFQKRAFTHCRKLKNNQ